MSDELLHHMIENVELLRLAAVGLAQEHQEARALADYASSVAEWLSQQAVGNERVH